MREAFDGFRTPAWHASTDNEYDVLISVLFNLYQLVISLYMLPMFSAVQLVQPDCLFYTARFVATSYEYRSNAVYVQCDSDCLFYTARFVASSDEYRSNAVYVQCDSAG